MQAGYLGSASHVCTRNTLRASYLGSLLSTLLQIHVSNAWAYTVCPKTNPLRCNHFWFRACQDHPGFHQAGKIIRKEISKRHLMDPSNIFLWFLSFFSLKTQTQFFRPCWTDNSGDHRANASLIRRLILPIIRKIREALIWAWECRGEGHIGLWVQL